jgi:hypothetical protein
MLPGAVERSLSAMDAPRYERAELQAEHDDSERDEATK